MRLQSRESKGECHQSNGQGVGEVLEHGTPKNKFAKEVLNEAQQVSIS